MLQTFHRFTQKQTHLVIGLMSGTSVDGVDAAVCEISGEPPLGPLPSLAARCETQAQGPAVPPGMAAVPVRLRVVNSHTEDFLPGIRARILAACRPDGGTSAEICELNFIIGEEFAHAAKNAIQGAGLTPADIDLIGSHGQTIAHKPPGQSHAGIQRGSTLQIGAAAVIAERTGIPVVSNFRTRDMAAGGQGAPLVPYADWLLFSSQTESRVALNIGGIANATCLPAACPPERIQAFDTGPGNMILDALAEKISGGKLACDKDGALAAAGKVNAALLTELLAHPYLQRSPPKSTGREEFGAEFAQRLFESARIRGLEPNDIMATATASHGAVHRAKSHIPIFPSARRRLLAACCGRRRAKPDAHVDAEMRTAGLAFWKHRRIRNPGAIPGMRRLRHFGARNHVGPPRQSPQRHRSPRVKNSG